MTFHADKISKAVKQHGRVARVTIVSTKGSAPRDAGTSMLVWRGGQLGTIGGGALEFEAVKRALASKGLQNIPLGPSLGQCCGGHVTLLIEHFDEESRIPPVPQPTREELFIYGAGHVGRALVSVIAPLPDFQITWVDTDFDRFPQNPPDDVTCLPTSNLVNATALAPDNAHHLIMTYSHEFDLELCHGLLGRKFASCGLIGSQTKWKRFKSKLTQLGHGLAEINRITCPIGDPSLGKHPQQIAVGVASSLMSRKNLQPMGKDRAI